MVLNLVKLPINDYLDRENVRRMQANTGQVTCKLLAI